MNGPSLRVVVVGGGVAGVVAAHLLARRHRVTLLEANDYVGGHTNTFVVSAGPDAGTPVDTGFIVFNERTYPHFQAFLCELGVAARRSDMSFSYSCRQTGLTYSSDFPNGVFAQRRNLWNPKFLGMLRDSFRFNRDAVRDLHRGALAGKTVGAYLGCSRYSKAFVENQLLPTASAIWSTSSLDAAEFPAEALVKFYENHGLLSHFGGARWRTVVGGSHAYVRAFLERFPGTVLTGARVRTLHREGNGVRLALANGRTLEADRAVVATHADQALALLADPSSDERRLLGVWRYARNRTVLHTDPGVMPASRRAWASWNYLRDPGADPTHPVHVTYWMNRLQGLDTREQYFVSLNEPRPIDPERVLQTLDYTHPTYTLEALRLQPELPALNGRRQTYFCGSYFGYGFHEDAVRSAVAVGRCFEVEP